MTNEYMLELVLEEAASKNIPQDISTLQREVERISTPQDALKAANKLLQLTNKYVNKDIGDGEDYIARQLLGWLLIIASLIFMAIAQIGVAACMAAAAVLIIIISKIVYSVKSKKNEMNINSLHSNLKSIHSIAVKSKFPSKIINSIERDMEILEGLNTEENISTMEESLQIAIDESSQFDPEINNIRSMFKYKSPIQDFSKFKKKMLSDRRFSVGSFYYPPGMAHFSAHSLLSDFEKILQIPTVSNEVNIRKYMDKVKVKSKIDKALAVLEKKIEKNVLNLDVRGELLLDMYDIVNDNFFERNMLIIIRTIEYELSSIGDLDISDELVSEYKNLISSAYKQLYRKVLSLYSKIFNNYTTILRRVA